MYIGMDMEKTLLSISTYASRFQIQLRIPELSCPLASPWHPPTFAGVWLPLTLIAATDLQAG